MAKRAHIFKFISNLKMHESRKSDTMYNLANDIVPDGQFDRRKLCDKERDKKIKNLTAKLTKGTISVARFLDDMAADEDEWIFE